MPRHNGTGVELLADPTRRRILSLVAVRPRRPSAIARDLGVHRSTATHQLRTMEKAGLIMSRRTRHDGRGILYLLNPQRVGHVVAWLAGTEVGGPLEEPSGVPPSAADSG